MLASQKIEDIIKTKIQSHLTENNISGISFITCWEKTEDGIPKGEETSTEEETSTGIVTIKTNLPTFETPTIPDCSFEVTLGFVSRTDADYTGKDYLTVTELIWDIVHGWQKSFSTVETDFTFDGFVPTGFQITASDHGLDKTNDVWPVSLNMLVFGIYQ